MVNGDGPRSGHALESGSGSNKSDLIAYLARLGLDDGELGQAFSLSRSPHGESMSTNPLDWPVHETPGPTRHGHADKSDTKIISVYLAEEQQILREAYMAFLDDDVTIDLLGVSDDVSDEGLVNATKALKPQVLLLGTKALQPATVEKLKMVREVSAEMALVLLFGFYDGRGIRALREFSMSSSVGCAYLFKYALDTSEQFTQVISSVAQGRIIVDPTVLEGMMRLDETHTALLGDLSPRELEVLSWVARGYRNDTIAQVLSRDIKTVERHMNNIYSKLFKSRPGDEGESRDPRVSAALMYLRATGMLPGEHVID